LQFVGATRVAEENIRGMPLTAFNFKDFSEIQAGKYRADLLDGNMTTWNPKL
jgi:hypothetical protein